MLATAATTTGDGASLLVEHGLHLVFIAGGITGLVVILLPQHLERFRRAEAVPQDAHEARVRQLRSELAGVATSRAVSDHPPVLPGASQAGPAPEIRLLPFMMVAGIASASAHAAVAPPHLLDNVLFGAFFIACAGAQLSWVVALLAGTDRPMLQWAVVGNAAVLLLWLITRLWGLPLGLMPDPEALGPWDVLCAIWELTVIGGCLRLLRSPAQGLRVPPLFDWTPRALAWLGSSGVLLLILSVSGAHS